MTSLPASVSRAADELPSLVVCNPHGRARVYLQGAHVASFRPVGEGEVLWTSVRSHFAAGKPIRGGIPVCFPWFGPHATRAELPPHGFARTEPWTLASAQDLPDGRTQLVLTLSSSEGTRAIWPHAFALTYTVTVGATLELALSVRNVGDAPFTFEEALHTYFDVADVKATQIEGLSGARYLDKVEGGAEKRQEGTIRFGGETDRVYPRHDGTCVILDERGRRRISVEKGDSRTTVVWNPWVAKAARMPDYGDFEWPGMVCVETANAVEDAITLGPGAEHVLRARIGVERG